MSQIGEEVVHENGQEGVSEAAAKAVAKANTPEVALRDSPPPAFWVCFALTYILPAAFTGLTHVIKKQWREEHPFLFANIRLGIFTLMNITTHLDLEYTVKEGEKKWAAYTCISIAAVFNYFGMAYIAILGEHLDATDTYIVAACMVTVGLSWGWLDRTVRKDDPRMPKPKSDALLAAAYGAFLGTPMLMIFALFSIPYPGEQAKGDGACLTTSILAVIFYSPFAITELVVQWKYGVLRSGPVSAWRYNFGTFFVVGFSLAHEINSQRTMKLDVVMAVAFAAIQLLQASSVLSGFIHHCCKPEPVSDIP